MQDRPVASAAFFLALQSQERPATGQHEGIKSSSKLGSEEGKHPNEHPWNMRRASRHTAPDVLFHAAVCCKVIRHVHVQSKLAK